MSVATVITQGFGTFGNVNFVALDGYGDYGGTVVPPTPTPEVSVVQSGVRKRRYRVRRSDFSSQENYEAALRMALLDSNFSIVAATETVEEPKPRTRRKIGAVPVDKSLSAQLDTEIRISAEKFASLQRAAEMEEVELMMAFMLAIEEDFK